MSSNVPAVQITATGVVAPDAVAVRAGVLADENNAFGGDLDIVTPATPQAHLADQLTENITSRDAAVSYVLAMTDPATSEGRFQDAIGRIYFQSRRGATASVVQALCTGQPGVTLAAGALAQDDAGNLWSSTGDAVFSGGGTATVQFACLVLGPVLLGIGELTKIAQTAPGWDAITNLGAATVGNSTESRAAFEIRRQESVAKNGRGTPPAIRSAVWEVDGVLDVFVYDNFTNAVVNYGATNYPLAPHSIYVGVVGGDDQEVADAIWSKKDNGCDMNGNTTVTVFDTEGYSFPYPEYEIKFERPASLPILFAVQIANSLALPADIVALTKAAIIGTFTGANGAQRARMGGLIFASNYYAGVASISPAVSILSIKVGTVTATLDSVSVGIDQSPTIDPNDIAVTLV
ncbi:hypothetical protein MAJJADAN_00040 [Pseudomonas phage Amjad_SA]|nr:hypothetical protein MAJJADAN_00040 [Pseudomonas phage Amjad_SA]